MDFSRKTLLVQLVERRFPKPDVVGSSPTGRAKISVGSKIKSPHRLEA